MLQAALELSRREHSDRSAPLSVISTVVGWWPVHFSVITEHRCKEVFQLVVQLTFAVHHSVAKLLVDGCVSLG